MSSTPLPAPHVVLSLVRVQATLTDADQRTLHDLNKNRVPALNSRLKTEFDALEVAAAARTRLVSILNGDLQKRREVGCVYFCIIVYCVFCVLNVV